MQIAVVGTGYVGLVTGACLADVGHTVTCLDIDEEKIEGLKQGVIPIFEPRLEDIVIKNHKQGLLSFTSDAKVAVENAEIVFIAVGTPPDEDGSADLQYVLAVAEMLAFNMPENCIVVDKSTVPVGTADKVRTTIEASLAKQGRKISFHVCSNPEFLKEGDAVEDFKRPARILIGTDSEYVADKMRECYAPYNRNHDRLMFMDVRSAELTKYAANAMLATRISFMNEIANIAEEMGADIEKVRLGIGSDPRIGYHFIYPGAGYGGSCFPKDVRALSKMASENGLSSDILTAVEDVNNRQKTTLFPKLEKALDGSVAGKSIAVWGLAFKPRTDDMRDAPSRVLIASILENGGTVQAFDPEARDEARRIFGDQAGISIVDDKLHALTNADALVICTEWKEFKVLDFAELKSTLNNPIVIDGRNLFEPQKMADAGFTYYSVGRKLIEPV